MSSSLVNCILIIIKDLLVIFFYLLNFVECVVALEKECLCFDGLNVYIHIIIFFSI